MKNFNFATNPTGDLLGLASPQVWDTQLAFAHLQARGEAHTKRTAERRLHEVASQWTISVADDGVGIGGNMLFGRGQTNMMARAPAAGGKLSVSNSHLTLSVTHPGTLVKLVVPLQKMGAV